MEHTATNASLMRNIASIVQFRHMGRTMLNTAASKGTDQNHMVICPTNIIRDTPCELDGLGGAHQRLAKAISHLIAPPKNETGTVVVNGGIIGLEGAWGSGKSSVIRMLQTELNDPPKDCEGACYCCRLPLSKRATETAVVVFDAWAHEGDPLRRTVLQRLVEGFICRNWLETKQKVEWEKWCDDQGKRVGKTDTRPIFNFWGKLTLLTLFAVPIGGALFNEGLKTGVVLLDARAGWNSYANWGLLLFFLPFLSLSASCLCRTKWVVKCMLRSGLKKFIPKQDDAWPLFAKTQSTETTSSAEIDPTSVEFERNFGKLMDDALKGKAKEHRKLVVVMDNLDRVDPEDARTIWSTMQTFLQSSEHGRRDWFKRLWIIVPFDRQGIGRLWGNGKAVTQIQSAGQKSVETAASSENHSHPGLHENLLPHWTESFLDKSLQMRFDVPPPALSFWRSQLKKLLEIALPSHTEEEFYQIERAYSTYRGNINPTPRELILFVNQIGVIHRQWCPLESEDAIPLHHMATYVMLRRTRSCTEIIDDIRHKRIPGNPDSALLASLSALAFNVDKTQARQLLLGDEIYSALERGDYREIVATADLPGFWEVFETISFEAAVNGDAAILAAAAYCLDVSHLFDEPRGARQQCIVDKLMKQIESVQTWKELDANSIGRIKSLLTLAPTASTAHGLLRITSNTPIVVSADAENTNGKDWARGFADIIAAIKEFGLDECLHYGMSVPDGAKGLLSTLSLLSKTLTDKELELLRPTAKATEIIEEMVRDISPESQKPVERISIHPLALSLLKKYDDALVLDDLVLAAYTRICNETKSANPIIFQLISNMQKMAKSDQGARDHLAFLNREGHVLHYLWLAYSVSDFTGMGRSLFSYLKHYPDCQSAPGNQGATASGYQLVMDSFAEFTEEVAQVFIEECVIEGAQDVFFGLLEQPRAPAKFLAACCIYAAQAPCGLNIFSSEKVVEYWSRLFALMGKDAAEALLSRLEIEANLSAAIVCNNFSEESCHLYRSIAAALPVVPAHFAQWCSVGLAAISSDSWTSYFYDDAEPALLVIQLMTSNVNLNLGKPYQAGLFNLLSHSLQSGDTSAAFHKNMPSLFMAMPAVSRAEFRLQAIKQALIVDRLPAGFFYRWDYVFNGHTCSNSDTDRAKAALIEKVVLAHNTLDGLEWVQKNLPSCSLEKKAAKWRMIAACNRFIRASKQANMIVSMKSILAILSKK